jgi:hypothetical protein
MLLTLWRQMRGKGWEIERSRGAPGEYQESVTTEDVSTLDQFCVGVYLLCGDLREILYEILKVFLLVAFTQVEGVFKVDFVFGRMCRLCRDVRRDWLVRVVTHLFLSSCNFCLTPSSPIFSLLPSCPHS